MNKFTKQLKKHSIKNYADLLRLVKADDRPLGMFRLHLSKAIGFDGKVLIDLARGKYRVSMLARYKINYWIKHGKLFRLNKPNHFLCAFCESILNISERTPWSTPGSNQCKSCVRKYQRKHYRNNHSKIRKRKSLALQRELKDPIRRCKRNARKTKSYYRTTYGEYWLVKQLTLKIRREVMNNATKKRKTNSRKSAKHFVGNTTKS